MDESVSTSVDMDDMGTSYIGSSNRNNNHHSSSSGSHTTRKENHPVQHSNKTIQTLPEKRDQSTFTYEGNDNNNTTANGNNESLMDRRHNNPIYPMQSFLDRKGKYSF